MTAQPDQAAQQHAEQLEDDLLEACELIREHWPALLTPPKGGSSNGAASTDTLTPLERRISLRQDVAASLTRWCRVIIRDRPLTAAALPDAGDERIEALLDLVERHAAWFAAEHDDAERAVRQLQRFSLEVRDTADPPMRDHVYLGPCPFVLPDPGGVEDEAGRTLLWACQGRILTRIGGDGSAHCTGCGQQAVREWWEDVLDLVLPLVSLPGLVDVLHRRLGIRVTDRTLRNWRRDGILRPHIVAANHPAPYGIGPVLPWDLFDPRRATEAVASMGRACTICGEPWDGGGDICRACWLATVQATPTIVDEPIGPRIAGIPVTIQPRRAPRPAVIVPDPHDTDRPERCHYGDLPLATCSCGNPLAAADHARGRAALEARQKARQTRSNA